ncbi:beclin-1-like [Hydractinia symbiolongicarpus]|uniref:beclin-1-like n=1 Tax=Hydractinia symbiolongicarpus TaxID=13093 RepID=UPI002549D779|nr:beclin-1-like [Hydractinia symbiolongicarpus]
MSQSFDTIDAFGKDTTHVSFVCQRCYQPLKLDNSLYSLDNDTQQELESPFLTAYSQSNEMSEKNVNTVTDLKSLSSADVVTKIVLPAKLASNEGSDFTLLGETSSGNKTDNLSHRLKVSTQLFDIMSGNADIDHPLCEDCTDNLLDQLDDQLCITEKELESYKDLLLQLESKNVMEDTQLDADLDKLKLEEKALLEELAMIEIEHKKTVEKKEELEKENEDLGKEEEKYWREYCEHHKSLLDFEDEQTSVLNQLQYAQSQLDKLRKTNVFNSTFHIWHKGHFGTINNFRLGRLPSVPVEWTEINAAWGQTVLLLHSLAKKIGLTFQRYRLVPYGNHSFIECLDDKSRELPLYGTGGFRFFWDTKFDHAMVAFLDCLQQFKEEVETGDSKFYLPYRMEKGKIYDSARAGAYSVKIQFNSEEHWTKALKFMLTNLKWGLAWVSSQFAEKNSK